jgi:hypothetical protein
VENLGEAVLYAVALALAAAVISMFVHQLAHGAVEGPEVLLISVLFATVGAGVTAWLSHRPAGH